VPEPEDDVIIDVASRDPLITVGKGPIQIRSLTSHERVRLEGTDLRVSGVIDLHRELTMAGGALRNTTVIQRQPNLLRFIPFATHTLDNVHLIGDLVWNANNGTTVQIRNGFAIEGTFFLDFNRLQFIGDPTWNIGTLVLGAGTALGFDGQLTFGPDLVIRGRTATIQGGTGTLINQGTMAVDVNAGQLFITASQFTNEGTIKAEAANSTITIRSANFTNTGVTQELNGGKIRVNP